jgi:DNA-binding MarR family transcriptional regulator
VIVKALSEKHSVSVLLGLLDNGEVSKMRIMKFGPSINSIDALLEILKREDLISVKEERRGRRVFLISLTEKGRKVAEILDSIRKMG